MTYDGALHEKGGPVDEQAEYLKRTPIFSGFSDTELVEVARLIIERKFKRNTVIFHENEPGTAFYVVKDGRVKVYKLAEDGRELIIGIFGDGGIFGDVPVFDGGPYPASAATMTDTVVWSISRRDFEQLVKAYPEISLKLIRVLGRRLRQAHDLLRDMALKNVPQRLAGLLLKLKEEYGSAAQGGTLLELPLSRQDMAELLGVSRETATRELSKFAKAGILDVDGRRITILDEPKLRLWSKM